VPPESTDVDETAWAHPAPYPGGDASIFQEVTERVCVERCQRLRLLLASCIDACVSTMPHSRSEV
jgi:hypothetical protein